MKKKTLLIFAALFTIFSLTAFAGGSAEEIAKDHSIFMNEVISSIVFGIIGILLAALGYKVFDWITPFCLTKELAEDQNVSIGIVVGSIIIGVSIIVAVAIL